MSIISYWWSVPKERIIEATHSDIHDGLNEHYVHESRKRFGPNIIQEIKPTSLASLIIESIQQPMMLLLLGIAFLSLLFGKLAEASAMIFVVATYIFIECVNTWRTDRIMVRLKKLASPITRVLRDGQEREIMTTEVVVGDRVVLSEGSFIPADARLIDAFGLMVNEASLTGESLPVAKDAETLVAPDALLAERSNSVFSGTTVISGQATALVVAVGQESEFGKIAQEVQKLPQEKTLLQESMTTLAKVLALFALVISALIPALGFMRGLSAQDMMLTWLALTFLMIPGQPPIIITMALALAAFELARKHILVKRLHGAEMMGQVTSIMSDKTGTITESTMQVETFYRADGTREKSLPHDVQEKIAYALPTYSNDPTDKAVRDALPSNLQQRVPYNVTGFSDKQPWRDMIYKTNDTFLHAIAGSPELLIARSLLTPHQRKELEQITKKEADAGKRIVAYAFYENSAHTLNKLKDLHFVALAVLRDPVRPGVQEAIKTLEAAGITTSIVTGDHPTTTQTIATEVGIPGSLVTGAQLETMNDTEVANLLAHNRIFARISPSQKLRLVKLLQAKGEIVAALGDGINDAPALKIAHVGIALGKIGTDLTKEVADLIITDDSYVHIPDAIVIGRKALDNFRKGLTYYLSAKSVLLIVFLIPLAIDIPFPFVPLQIIIIELLMDIASSTIFVTEPAEPDSMHKPARTINDFLNYSLIASVLRNSIGLALGITLVYVHLYVTQGIVVARTAAFVTWLLGHIFLALNLKQDTTPLIEQGFLSNYSAVLWLLAMIGISLAMTSISALYPYLHTTHLSLVVWIQVIACAFLSTWWIELKKILIRI